MAFTGQRRALEDIDANEEPTKEERLLPQSAKSIHTYLINRLSDALSPKSKIFDAELKRTWSRLDRRTRQMNARDPTPLWTPPAPYTIRPPDPPPRLMFTRAPYHIQPLGGPTRPWPVPIILTPVAPPLTESPALPPLPENY